jgi:hypothetical protein
VANLARAGMASKRCSTRMPLDAARPAPRPVGRGSTCGLKCRAAATSPTRLTATAAIDGSRGGLKAVGELDAARPAPKVGRGRKEEEQRELPLLPAGCPVKPLGKLGQLCFYLDEQGQLISLTPRDHGKTHIQSLFGRRSGLVHTFWPRYGKPDDDGEPVITGWKPEGGRDPAGGVRPCRAVRPAGQGPRPRRLARAQRRAHHPPRRQGLSQRLGAGLRLGRAGPDRRLRLSDRAGDAAAGHRPGRRQARRDAAVAAPRAGTGSGRRSTPICCSASSPRPRSAARSTGDRTCG